MQPNQHYWYPSTNLNTPLIFCAHCALTIDNNIRYFTKYTCTEKDFFFCSKIRANKKRDKCTWDWIKLLEVVYNRPIEIIDPTIKRHEADLHYTISESTNYVNEQAYVKTFKKTLVFMNEAKALRENPP